MEENFLLFILGILVLMAVAPIVVILKRKYGKPTIRTKLKKNIKAGIKQDGEIKDMGIIKENLILLGGNKFLGFLFLIIITPLIGNIIDMNSTKFLGPLGVMIFIFLGIIPYLIISYWKIWGKYLFAVWFIYWIYLFTH